jgi:hypothetical protein
MLVNCSMFELNQRRNNFFWLFKMLNDVWRY